MNFTYENQGSNTFMVYEVGADEKIDSMSLGMITNNKILGLAPTIFFQQDTTKYFKYNISAKVSADQFLMGVVNKKRLIGVFQGIVNAMLSAEEYMIDTNSICLDLQYIFTDVSTCETVLVCLPVVDLEKLPVDLKAFFKNIVFGTQFDQTENCDYVAKLFNHLNSASVFSLIEFKELLDEIERGGTPVQQPVPVPRAVSVQSAPAAVQQSAPQLVQKVETVAQTTVIPQAMPVQPTVVPKPIVSEPVATQVQKPTSNVSFAIPGQKADPVQHAENVTTESQKVSDEKEMSFVYLMRNYTKENAAIYKAQQDAKKAAKATATPEKKDKKDKKEKKGKEPSASPMNAAFAIPGQPTAPAQPLKSNPVIVPQPAPAPVVQPAAYSAPQPTAAVSAPAPASQPATMAQPVGMPANFGETTVLSSAGIGETTVLGASPVMQEIKPYLVRSKNNEKIILDKPVFRIGKERSYVDYFIGDNSAISRSHANIVQRDGEYFVVDTNSTNHTYVNGGMLQSNVETKISHGTKIRLANEDFEFKLY